MLRPLLLKEARLAWRSRRVWLAALGMSLLSVIASASGASEHVARRAQYLELSAYGEAAFNTQKAAHPHQIAHNGYIIARPPAPLGFLDGGVELAYGNYLRLDAHRTRALAGARTSELTRGPGAGRFDLGVLFAFFAPALVILLGYDQIVGERTRKTLDILCTLGVTKRVMFFSKVAGLSIRTGIAVVLPALLGVVLAIGITGEAPLLRVMVWLAVHALALWVWMALVLAISALAKTREGALLGGLSVWAVLALAIPPLAGSIAAATKALPPAGEEIVQAETWAASAHEASEELRARAVRDVQRRHPSWNGLDPAPEILDAVMLRLADADIAQKVGGLLDRLERDGDEQERIAILASSFSPSGLASLASSAIAGSDLAHMRSTWRHYEEHRVRLMAWFNEWWAKNGGGGFESFDGEKSFAAFQDAPRLVEPSRPLEWSFARAQSSVWLLFCLLALASIAAIRGLE